MEYTIKQVAKKLNTHRSSVRRWINEGLLETEKKKEKVGVKTIWRHKITGRNIIKYLERYNEPTTLQDLIRE